MTPQTGLLLNKLLDNLSKHVDATETTIHESALDNVIRSTEGQFEPTLVNNTRLVFEYYIRLVNKRKQGISMLRKIIEMQYLSQLEPVAGSEPSTDADFDLSIEQFELPEEITLERFLTCAAYVRTPANTLSKAMDILQNNGIRYEDYTFIDIGSGLGYVLAEASAYSFRKIKGIEISEYLHHRCVRTIGALDKTGRRCADIESICNDVMTFPFPESNLILYMWEPLERSTGKKFLTSINDFALQKKLALVVIFIGENYGAPSMLHKLGGDLINLPGNELDGIEISAYSNCHVNQSS